MLARDALWAGVTSPGFEDALAVEIGSGGPATGTPRWPAVVSTRRLPAAADPVFARQALPDARLVRGDTMQALVDAASAQIAPAIEATRAAWTFHAYVPDPGPYRRISSRAAEIGQGTLARLRTRAPQAFARYLAPENAIAQWPGVLLGQVAVVGRTSLIVSTSVPRALPLGGYDLAPWPAGRAPVAEDRRAPSRAYRKLEESFAWLGRAPDPGALCVDLGGAPGGWAWTALKRGARVIAVDRSSLVAPVLGHPELAMVVGNALAYQPPKPADWLLCDVICEPARTFDLVHRWMMNGWCRHVVASVKFKGATGYGILDPARQRLAALGWRFLRLKHLANHHNEVVILASR